MTGLQGVGTPGVVERCFSWRVRSSEAGHHIIGYAGRICGQWIETKQDRHTKRS